MKKTLRTGSWIASRMTKCVLIALCAGTVHAHDGATNKTFMNPRSHGTNLEYWYGAGTPELINKKNKNKFGGTFFATGFYTDGKMASEYWAADNKNGFLLNTAFTEFGEVKATFDPSQIAYGATLAYDHRLDKILKGLYVNVQLPIVHVENDLELKLEGDGTTDVVVKDFFAGKDQGTHFINYATEFKKVNALSHARIDGQDSTTSIADIDVRLGYNFLNKCNYHASFNLGLTIPTGKDSEAIMLNEAIVGNGQHFGLGCGLAGDARIWGNHTHNFIVYGDLQYKYLFEASGKRTLGLKKLTTKEHYQYAQYLPLTHEEAGTAFADTEITPGANVLTQNVDITPGSQFEGVIAIAYNNGGFSANFGYNMYYREAEDVDLKDANVLDILPTWNIFTGANEETPTEITTTVLAKENLDVCAAETPSQLSNKVFGGIAWTFKNWQTPVNVGAGAHYEFINDRRGYKNWGLNAHLGIGF